ncbi:hypothetical protein [Streptomyces coerulescens]|uniref:Uncharacterized protein n=1 Tax=Streptomyces coerulescens TaxID=29304 RepID=A0ABW0CZ51_STRCD
MVDLEDGYYKLVNRPDGMVIEGRGSTGEGAPAPAGRSRGSRRWPICGG